MPRGMDFVHSYSKSRLPSPRKVSWELHHDGLYPFGDILSAQDTLGSDPTCAPELRFAGCDSCEEPTCQNLNRSKTCEFNQPCPNDGTTAARLGGDGALVTHMVSWKKTEQHFFQGDAVRSVCGTLIFHDITSRWFNQKPKTRLNYHFTSRWFDKKSD